MRRSPVLAPLFLFFFIIVAVVIWRREDLNAVLLESVTPLRFRQVLSEEPLNDAQVLQDVAHMDFFFEMF